MKDNFDFFDILKYRDIETNDETNKCKSKAIVSLILCVAASIMLIMNLKNHSMVMAYSSIVLVAGFLVSAIVSFVFKNSFLSGVIIALLVGFVLSVFAITGGNEGFAILWILLVPMFAISLLGVVPGLVVSTYFLVFLFVIFSTPIRVNMADKYNASFISRFPILYLCDYVISTFLSLQRTYYHKKLEYQAYSDGLTGLYNRRYFMKNLHKLNEQSNYSIVMVDLNGLKIVNDRLGHDAGDDFICKVSEIFANVFKKNAIVCRIGGDEIAIISFDESKAVSKLIEKAKEIANKENKNFNFELSFAVGMAGCSDKEGLSPEEVLKIADENMYKCKIEYYEDDNHNRRKR